MKYKAFLVSVVLGLTLSGAAQQPQTQPQAQQSALTQEQMQLVAFQTQRALLLEKLHAITEFQQWMDTEANIRILSERIRQQAATQTVVDQQKQMLDEKKKAAAEAPKPKPLMNLHPPATTPASK